MQPRYIFLEQVSSTNDFLKHYGGDGETVVAWTDFQQAGRGQGENRWESERGKNLTFSILLHPKDVPAREQYIISMAIAVALRRCLAQMLGREVTVKWPNDIYVGDRKICGTLIENSLSGANIMDSIVGTGLNVNQTAFVGDAPNPVSMVQLTGKEWQREEVLHTVVDAFLWQMEHCSREDTRREYRENLYRREGFHPYRDASGTFQAEILTVEDDGHLVLRDAEGTLRRYAFKELQFLFG